MNNEVLVWAANIIRNTNISHPMADIDERICDTGRSSLCTEVETALNASDIDERRDVNAVTIVGTPEARAAKRPMIPALLWCV